MKFNLKRIIFLLVSVLLLSCSKDEDIDPKNTSDLSITVEADTDTPTVGTNLIFTLTATNNGPLDATDVVVKDKIPSGFTIVDFETSLGEYDAATGIWTIGSLNNQETATLTIEVTVNSTGDYNNAAIISGGQTDLSDTNSSSSVVFTPIPLTGDILFTYAISEGDDKFVTITGLSAVWEGLSGTYKSDITVPSEIEGFPVTVIGAEAFEDYSELVNVVLPNTIKTIDSRAFNDCSGLKNINIPNGVTYIGFNSFRDCTSLTSLSIPNGVITIEEGAFEYCSSLIDITIPDSVTKIEDYLFAYCTNLKSIKLPINTESIGYRAFYDCPSLTTVNLPSNLKVIESSIFYGCSSLTEIIIPDTVEEIGDFAFIGCDKVTNIKIPDNLKKIGIEVFNGCSSLTSFTIDSNPYFSVIDGVLYDKSAKILLSCPNAKEGSFVIPSSVTEIGHGAFLFCKNITSLTIPNSVVAIRSNAIRFCSGLTTISIPNSVQNIGFLAFSDNPSLKSVTMNPLIPPVVVKDLLPFNNCENLTDSDAIKVPANSLDAYESANGWSQYAAIIGAQ